MLGTYYFTLCFSVIEINAIFVQLCGLSPIYVAAHEPGRNINWGLRPGSFGPFVVETRLQSLV